MAFKKFSDFLNEQRKANKWNLPPKTDEPKDHAKAGKYIKPDEYYAPGAKKDAGLVTADDDRGTPLGDKGMPGMTPKVSHPLGKKPAGAPKKMKMSKGKMPKKMKNEEFLNVTSEMSDAQFTHVLLENQNLDKPVIHDLYGNKYTPEPAETMRYVADLMLKNESMMSRMVREIKRNEGISNLISEIFAHPETYKIISEITKKDERVARKINEAVADPRGMSGNSGSGIGPSGATAGRTPMVKNGASAGGMPPGPPSSEDEEIPSKGGDDLLDTIGDESDEENDDDDELEDGNDEENDDDNDKHTHVHIHHHHHGKKDKDLGMPKLGKKPDMPPPDMNVGP